MIINQGLIVNFFAKKLFFFAKIFQIFAKIFQNFAKKNIFQPLVSHGSAPEPQISAPDVPGSSG